jgi:glycosyltransferase involved in cell wall biosynthesis
MRLGINGWRIHGQRTGIGRYLLNVVKHWTSDGAGSRFETITFYTPRPLDLREIELPRGVHTRVLRPAAPLLLWENTRLGPASADDVLFCPSYTRPILTRGRTVVTTHDAVLPLYPELFPRTARYVHNPLYAWSARRATLVITDSEAARQDIARMYRVPLSRIRVVYLAPAECFRLVPQDRSVNEVRERFVGPAAPPFFLFVGKLSGRRNLPLLLEAFAEFKRRVAAPHKLLLVGLNIHNLDMPGHVARLGIGDHVVHHSYVSDEDLNLLYNAALAFISPATYETVSLPVMEAQATGTPVICIDTAGMREITGGAALFIPTLGVPEMVDAMRRMATDGTLRAELGEKGRGHARQFSWRRCSAETMEVLEEAAGMSPRLTPKIGVDGAARP